MTFLLPYALKVLGYLVFIYAVLFFFVLQLGSLEMISSFDNFKLKSIVLLFYNVLIILHLNVSFLFQRIKREKSLIKSFAYATLIHLFLYFVFLANNEIILYFLKRDTSKKIFYLLDINKINDLIVYSNNTVNIFNFIYTISAVLCLSIIIQSYFLYKLRDQINFKTIF